MTWEDILKKKRRREEPPKNYGFRSYAGAGEAARKKREAILNDPEIKEKARINKLKSKAESKIKRLNESVKSIEDEVKYAGDKDYPPKPEEHDAGVEWEKNRDITADAFYTMIRDMEQKRGYADFLRESIKSNFEGVSMNEYQEKRGNMYSITFDYNEGISIYEGGELGDWEKRAKEVFNRLMRKMGWGDKVRKL